jgi:ATP-dependent protease ClpP protease subunit
MATTFIKNLHLLERQNNDPIIIHMHTVGGDWNDGMAISDAIKLSPCPTVTINYAHASSMSSIIPQAADRRLIMPSADVVIHYGTISLEDQISTAAKSTIEWNQRSARRMIEMYLARCRDGAHFKDSGMTDKQIVKFLDNKMRYYTDWYLTAEQAVDFGFMDAVMGSRGYETMEKIKNVRKRRW